jgi:hypothetical protein
MKAPFYAFTLTLFLVAGLQLKAQTNAAAPTPPPDAQTAKENKMLAFLTPAEQVQYATARAKALTDNPDLKSEGDVLLQQASSVMSDGKPEEKQAFMEKMMTHRQKLRQAMLKVDPTLSPVFAKIDKHISELKSKQLGQVQNSGASSNAAPSAAPSGQ